VNNIHIQYGAAIIAAPLFVLFYISLFQDQSVNLEVLLSDKKALFFLLIFYPVIEELAFRGVIPGIFGY